MKSPLYILDSYAIVYRSYFAFMSKPLRNASGANVGAAFGFFRFLFSLFDQRNPPAFAAVFDPAGKTFRHDMYPEYKANRSAMPEDLIPQMPYVKKFVEALGLPGFEQPGFEADDIIGTLAERAAHMSKEADVCIVSSDKDLMQLVNGHIYLYDTMKEVKYTPAEVKEKLGVLPPLVADYLGIVGDTSDNIPGVKGIGPKGAVALLEQFGSVEAIY